MLTTPRREAAAVGMLALVALVINLAMIVQGPGEPDAARQINEALITFKSGVFTAAVPRMKVLPIYVLLVNQLVGQGLGADAVLKILAVINAAAGALIMIPLYALWRRLISADIAFAALLVVNLLPTFWVAHLYGFPTLPGLLFAATAVALLVSGNETEGRASTWMGAGAVLAAAIAGGLKADLILMASAFPALLLFSPRIGVRQIALAFVVPAVMLLTPFVLADVFFGLPVFAPGETMGSVQDWSNRWPATLATFVGVPNLRVMLTSAGGVLAALAAVGAVRCLGERRLVALLLFIAAWSVPAIVFWGTREGNSPRHLLAPYVGLAPLVPIAIWGLVRWEAARFAVLLGGLTLNYLSVPPSGSFVHLGTRLIELRNLMQGWINRLLGYGSDFRALDSDRKALIGSSTNPFVEFEIFRDAETMSRRERDDGSVETRVTYPDGRSEVIAVYAPPRAANVNELVNRLRAEGFAVRSYERTLP